MQSLLYEIEIKRSARRINGAASEWVARRGDTRTFATKADARRWAETISGDGEVRIQDVSPNDPDEVDGYLVADPNRGRQSRAGVAGTVDSSVERYGRDKDAPDRSSG